MEVGATGQSGAIARYLVAMEPVGGFASAIIRLHNLVARFAGAMTTKRKHATTFLVQV